MWPPMALIRSLLLDNVPHGWGRLPRPLALLLGVYLFIYVFAVPMLMFGLVPAWGEWMGGFLIMLQGTLLALWLGWEAGIRGAVAAVLIGVLSYLVEYVGVVTGLPFGHYTYTPVLGLQLGGAVPLPIPFAWLIVVPGALMVAAPLRRPAIVIPVAALLALWLDLLIEPVAAFVTNYWQWQGSGPYYGVPTTNFVAWGGTALVLAGILYALAPRILNHAREPWLPVLIFGLNVVQFTLVDLAHGYVIAAMLGMGLLLVLWLLQARWRSDAEGGKHEH
jgi:bisanhydrobacterioruberin hydratase